MERVEQLMPAQYIQLVDQEQQYLLPMMYMAQEDLQV